MTRNASALPALRLVSLLALAGCAGQGPTNHDPNQEHADVGRIGLELLLPDGSQISEVEWRLLRDGEVVRTGTTNAGNDGRVSLYLSGISAGSGYTMEMTAPRSGGQRPCEGRSPAFEVVASQTTTVSVTLQCDAIGGEGAIAVEGRVNVCPSVPSIVASPTSTRVSGTPVSLSAASSDPEGRPVTYSWTASGGGRFSDAAAPVTRFTCTAPGSATLSVSVDDGAGCTKQASLQVTCEARCDVQPTSDFRTLCDAPEDQVSLARGLSVSYVTREIANNADQFSFWPHGSSAPTHIVFCIESSREELPDGRLQPSVQVMDIESKQIHTVLRGMVGCDGIRTTPWGTVLATEEFADDNGGLYEILFDPTSHEGYSITERGANGAAAAVVDSAGNDAASHVTKRVATPSMAWEGLLALPSGVIIGGDEERPGSIGADADGGAIFKFVPSVLRTATTPITALAESPLVAGTTWALQVSCVNNQQQFGQGCEIGMGAWVQVEAASARPSSNERGGTGYYRPEDLELDPHFAGPGIRFCFANTGNAGSQNYGEVLCAVDSDPNAASPTARSVVVNRLIEGDAELNQPDNVAFHPTVPGLLYVIEDNGNGDVWACLPDGADRDIKSDGCVRMLSLADRTSEPTGFIFTPDGRQAYVVAQHSRDGNMPFVDGYATDDLLLISGFAVPQVGAVQAFGGNTQSALEGSSAELFGFGTPLASSATVNVARASTFPGGVAPTAASNGRGEDASSVVALADGLSASYLTRVVANNADQFEFWPYGSQNPQYLMFCIEGSRELVAPDKYNPSVQAVDIETGAVRTIVRGMVGCDGLRVSPWGTLLATEEFADDNGALYEILWDPASDAEYTLAERGANGAPALIVDAAGNDASGVVVKRTALPSMAWEGLLVLDSGVIIGGDEERPGSVAADADGGAIFKFVPSVLRTGSGPIASLDESPLVAGANYALQISCVNNQQQFGQGCEVGNAAWVPVAAASARPDADAVGATGYYRPEDLQIDPDYAGPGVRFCVANTGNAGAGNYGEVLCAVDRQPDLAIPTTRTVTLNRFFEGDTQLNQPDNVEFQPGSGALYVIEDAAFGDVWACLPDGADRDIKSDGCVRSLSVKDRGAEPTGFKFHPNGTTAYVVVQHSADPTNAKVDDYNTDDIVVVSGFGAVSAQVAASFGVATAERLAIQSPALFGLGTPLATSAGQ
jgi:secreted PhoX family phosphatase